MTMLIVFWLLCGVVAAIIAHSRKREPMGWFLLGCLIGVFALVLVLALPALKAEPSAPSRFAQETHEAQLPATGGSKVVALATVLAISGLAAHAFTKVFW